MYVNLAKLDKYIYMFPYIQKGYILRNESVVQSKPLKEVIMVKADSLTFVYERVQSSVITAVLPPYASSTLCLTDYDNTDDNNKDKVKSLTIKSQITLIFSYLDPCKAWHCCLSCMS